MANELSLICFDFKLQSIKGLLIDGGLVSRTDYGSHLVKCLEVLFETRVNSTGVTINTPHRVWNETLSSSDGRVLITLRAFDRSERKGLIYNFLVTLTIETFGYARFDLTISWKCIVNSSNACHDYSTEVLLPPNRESVDQGLEKRLFEFARKERRRLSDALDGNDRHTRPPHQEILDYLSIIRRGKDLSPYYKTSDDRIVQHNIKGDVLYDVR